MIESSTQIIQFAASEVAAASGTGQRPGLIPSVHLLNTQITVFVIQIVFIFTFCKFCSLIGQCLQQPRLPFEIIGGFLLGPSAFGVIHGYSSTAFPKDSVQVIYVFANIGFQLFTFLLGLEIDLSVLLLHWKDSLTIAASVFLVSYSVGVAFVQVIYSEMSLQYDTAGYVSFALFFASFLSVAAFPVLAESLQLCGLHMTKLGSLSMGAAAILNTLTWLPFTLSVCIKTGHSLNVGAWLFFGNVMFALLLLTAARAVLARLVPLFEKHMRGFKNDNNIFSLALVLMLFSGWVVSLLGQDPLVGTFLFGVIVPRGSKVHSASTAHLAEFVSTLFLPLYFTVVALHADVTVLRVMPDVWLFFAICGLLVVTRFLSASIAAYLTGCGGKASTVVGLLMTSTGLVQFVLLSIARSAGIVDQRLFTLLLLVNIATSLVVFPLLRAVYPPLWTPSTDTKTFAMERQERAEPLTAQQLARLRAAEEARATEAKDLRGRDPEWGERSSPHRLKEEFNRMSTGD